MASNATVRGMRATAEGLSAIGQAGQSVGTQRRTIKNENDELAKQAREFEERQKAQKADEEYKAGMLESQAQDTLMRKEEASNNRMSTEYTADLERKHKSSENTRALVAETVQRVLATFPDGTDFSTRRVRASVIEALKLANLPTTGFVDNAPKEKGGTPVKAEMRSNSIMEDAFKGAVSGLSFGAIPMKAGFKGPMSVEGAKDYTQDAENAKIEGAWRVFAKDPDKAASLANVKLAISQGRENMDPADTRKWDVAVMNAEAQLEPVRTEGMRTAEGVTRAGMGLAGLIPLAGAALGGRAAYGAAKTAQASGAQLGRTGALGKFFGGAARGAKANPSATLSKVFGGRAAATGAGMAGGGATAGGTMAGGYAPAVAGATAGGVGGIGAPAGLPAFFPSIGAVGSAPSVTGAAFIPGTAIPLAGGTTMASMEAAQQLTQLARLGKIPLAVAAGLGAMFATRPEETLASTGVIKGSMEGMNEGPIKRMAIPSQEITDNLRQGIPPHVSQRLSQMAPTTGNARMRALFQGGESPFGSTDPQRVGQTSAHIEKQLRIMESMGAARGGLHPQEVDFYRKVIAERKREILFTFGAPALR